MDNWGNKSQSTICARCMYFVEKEGDGTLFGRCRRHAPTINGHPAVFGVDWCGDHRLDDHRSPIEIPNE